MNVSLCLRTSAILVSVMVLGACAHRPPPLPPVTGPAAVISDSATMYGGSGLSRGAGLFFYVVEVNGFSVPEDSRGASQRASQGMGGAFRLKDVERTVPAGDVKLKLRGTLGYAAPAMELALLRDTDQVEGVVEVRLEAGKRYRVKGDFDALKREVWLQEERSQEIVGPKLTGKPDPDAAAIMANGPVLYACCNLRYDGDWISDQNPAGLPFIPAGTRMALKDYSAMYSFRASVLADGRPMRVGLDYGRKQQSREEFVNRLMVSEDPKLKLASYPPHIRSAIEAGKIRIGMSKEQVLMSLGYPRMDATPTITASEWRYWTRDDEEYVVYWDEAQRVKGIDASVSARRLVLQVE